jgi:hypothetical protein
MTLTRIGVGATLSFGILCVWLGACSTNSTESCGNDGELQGTCQTFVEGDNDGCPSGMTSVNTSDSNNTGCPPSYQCCTPFDASPAPVQQGSGSGS